MKNIILILTTLLICSNIFAQTKNLRVDLLTGASGGGSWKCIDCPTTLTFAQDDDNPQVDFTDIEYGLYIFEYKLCSVNCPTCCAEVETCFYNVNEGNIEVTNLEFCNDETSLLTDLFTNYIYTSDATYTISGDLVGDETLVIDNLDAGTYNFTLDVTYNDPISTCNGTPITLNPLYVDQSYNFTLDIEQCNCEMTIEPLTCIISN